MITQEKKADMHSDTSYAIIENCYHQLEFLLKQHKRELPFYKLSAWLTKWYNTYKVGKVSPSTLVNIDCTIRLHIDEQLKSKYLHEITSLEIRQAINSIHSTKQQQETYDVLNQSFREAFLNDFIPSNPMLKVNRPKHRRENGIPLSSQELKVFLQKISGSTYERYYLFMLNSGVRPGEALALRWQDIDLENDCIHIHGTKNETSDRTIPLFKVLRLLLEQLQTEQLGTLFDGRVFPHSYKRMLIHFKENCPHPTSQLHKPKDLRHTFASHCARIGVNMKTTQLWLGHASIKTTGNVYTHVLSEYEKLEAIKVDNLYK